MAHHEQADVQADVLDAGRVEHLVEHGWVVVPGCFTAQDCADWVERAWRRLGVDPDDTATWTRPRVHLPSEEHVDVGAFAPKALAAALQLLGGAERADLPWRWSDVVSRGGGTFVATDAVGVVARALAEHPGGLLPGDLQESSLVRRCEESTELTGSAGDVVLLHPFVLHATSQNVLLARRLITNPPIALREPMRFDREDPAEHSPVERAVLAGLGVDRHAFRPTAPREAVVPPRLQRAGAAAG